MRGRWAVLAVVGMVCCALLPLRDAQAQLAELIPGVNVRVRAPGSIAGRFSGTVVSRTADSLTIASANGVPVQLPFSRLTAVEISRGKSRSRGAMKGALWGAGVGLLSGLFSDSGPSSCTSDCVSRGEAAGAGLLGGAMLGAAIGAAVQSERWDRLALPVSTALLPSGVGALAVVSIRF